MCFAIPLRVEKTEKDHVIVEGGKKIRTGRAFKVKKGEFLRITGNVAVDKLSKTEGVKIRKLIKSIYETEDEI